MSCGSKNGDRVVKGWIAPGEHFGSENSSVASCCCQLTDNMHEQTLGERRWKDEERVRGEAKEKQDKIDTLKRAKWSKKHPTSSHLSIPFCSHEGQAKDVNVH